MEDESCIIIEKVKKFLTCANQVKGKHYIKNLISLPCGLKACSECSELKDGVFLNCEICRENHNLDKNIGQNYDYLFQNYGLLLLSHLMRDTESFLTSTSFILT